MFRNSYLTECLTLEVTIDNKNGYIITLYRSPGQTSDEFDSFISNLEKLLINVTKEILFDRMYDEPLFIYSRFVGMSV